MKIFHGLLMSIFSLLLLSGCNESPVQHVLSADPDKLAQAINTNIDSFSYLVQAKDCIQLIYAPNHNAVIIRNNSYVKTQAEVNDQCNSMFEKLANSLNQNSEFKGLTADDLKNKALWGKYYQSKYAKFKFQ